MDYSGANGAESLFSFRPELLYSNKAYGRDSELYSGDNTKTREEVKQTMNYIDVPLLAHVKAGNLFFDLGPTVSFLVGAKQKYNLKVKQGSNVIDEGSKEESNKDNFAGFDASYAAGIGYHMDGGIGVGLRYNGRIKSIIDTKDMEEPIAKHSVFQLSLMYIIPGKK